MANSATPSAGRIFISYRREETAYPAGWLFDRLADHFGRGQIFKDIDSIQPGDDFVDVITKAVASCDVLLALIGEQWLTITDEQGRARLDRPDDFVRLELEAALTRNVRVIPILVAGARMPHGDQLPPSIAKLVHRQALELSPSRFDFDYGRLLKVLDSTLADVHAQQVGRGGGRLYRDSSGTPNLPRRSRPPGGCEAQSDLLGALRHHAAAAHWQAVLDVNAELARLDPSAADPDGLATQAQHVSDEKRAQREAQDAAKNQAEEQAQRETQYTRGSPASITLDSVAEAGTAVASGVPVAVAPPPEPRQPLQAPPHRSGWRLVAVFGGSVIVIAGVVVAGLDVAFATPPRHRQLPGRCRRVSSQGDAVLDHRVGEGGELRLITLRILDVRLNAGIRKNASRLLHRCRRALSRP